MDALKTEEFINSQLSLMQTLRSTKASEEKMIDTYKFILSVIMVLAKKWLWGVVGYLYNICMAQKYFPKNMEIQLL